MEKTMRACNNEVERAGLEEIMVEIKNQTRKVKRANNSIKKRWRRKKARERFYRNPYEAGKELLEPQTKMELKVSQEELNRVLVTMAVDPDREVPLGKLFQDQEALLFTCKPLWPLSIEIDDLCYFVCGNHLSWILRYGSNQILTSKTLH